MTLEYATDQLTEALQRVTRRAIDEPAAVAAETGLATDLFPALVSIYGVDVVYGSTLKDVEAVARSFDTQIQLSRPVNAATLTGRTPLDEVRTTLARLTNPETDFSTGSISLRRRRCCPTASTSTGSTSWSCSGCRSRPPSSSRRPHESDAATLAS